jgi:hypothetical protein
MDLEMRLINPRDRAVAEEEDRENRFSRVTVKMSFNNIVCEFLLFSQALHIAKCQVELAILREFVEFTDFFQFVHLKRGTQESL